MEIKEGFKQTEIGIFPTDWNTKPCSAISELITVGIVIRPTQYYVKQGVPALRSANVREDGINDLDMVFISERANRFLSKSQLRTNDVVSVRTGYPGTSAVVPSSLEGANCIDLLITRPSKSLNSQYLAYWINSSHGKDQVLRNQGGLAQQHFNVAELRNLVVALPPTLAEQKAIAEALRDADALIEALEQLLAKKRQVKQGAMQELLTGKRRLPGFENKEGYKQTDVGIIPEDWEVLRLRNACKLHNGRAYALHEWETSGTPVIRLQNLTGGDEYYYSTLNLPEEKYCYSGDLLFMWSATFGPHIWTGEKAIYHYHIWKVTPLVGKATSKYIFYRLFAIAEEKKTRAANGGTMLHVTKGEMEGTSIALPTIAEQTAIAEILSDMDAEIAALEAKLSKAWQVKQGMMSVLLTGRVRLV